jgi:hypothetical protein
MSDQPELIDDDLSDATTICSGASPYAAEDSDAGSCGWSDTDTATSEVDGWSDTDTLIDEVVGSERQLSLAAGSSGWSDAGNGSSSAADSLHSQQPSRPADSTVNSIQNT